MADPMIELLVPMDVELSADPDISIGVTLEVPRDLAPSADLSEDLELSMDTGPPDIPLDAGIVFAGADVEPFEGPYVVRSEAHMEQTFDSAGKRMLHDLTVQEIMYHQVSNEAGGNTVTIG